MKPEPHTQGSKRNNDRNVIRNKACAVVIRLAMIFKPESNTFDDVMVIDCNSGWK